MVRYTSIWCQVVTKYFNTLKKDPITIIEIKSLDYVYKNATNEGKLFLLLKIHKRFSHIPTQ